MANAVWSTQAILGKTFYITKKTSVTNWGGVLEVSILNTSRIKPVTSREYLTEKQSAKMLLLEAGAIAAVKTLGFDEKASNVKIGVIQEFNPASDQGDDFKPMFLLDDGANTYFASLIAKS